MEKTRVSNYPPSNLPLFNLTSYQLFGVASGLIQNETERKFLVKVLDELQRTYKEEEKEVRG